MKLNVIYSRKNFKLKKNRKLFKKLRNTASNDLNPLTGRILWTFFCRHPKKNQSSLYVNEAKTALERTLLDSEKTHKGHACITKGHIYVRNPSSTLFIVRIRNRGLWKSSSFWDTPSSEFALERSGVDQGLRFWRVN